MKFPTTCRLTLIVSIALLVMGCAKPKPFVYHPDSEIPEGPGLFSKEKGAFVIYDTEKEKSEGTSSAESKTDTWQDQAPSRLQEATGVDNKTNTAEEYRQFQQWQQDQKQYQEFKEWKQSGQNTREYQEFLEWKRWKEYKQWQENQQNKD